MKIGGFDISAKKVITGITLFTAGTIAAVMGKSKINDSVTKSEDANANASEPEEIEDAEVIELSEETEETDEPVIDVEENEPEEV